MWAIVHDILSEDGTPVTTHIFYGKTREEANSIYRSHTRTDAFLRDADKFSRFGKVKLRTRVRVEERDKK
jgi:hypothetical protein